MNKGQGSMVALYFYDQTTDLAPEEDTRRLGPRNFLFICLNRVFKTRMNKSTWAVMDL